MSVNRCDWVTHDPLYLEYHDKEWGVPIYDDKKLFEFLILEGQQAGLSWITILKKRAHYSAAFYHFDACEIVKMDSSDVERLMHNPGIVRNRLKIKSVITNAQAFLDLQQAEGFSNFLWQFVNGKPQINQHQTMDDVPTHTPASDAMAKALKQKGFKFVGTTICYAFMQATGMVNDHLITCFRHPAK